MSLKGDRLELETDVTFFGNSVMTRGGIATFGGYGSGAANDQSVAYVQYAANSSGAFPLGILLNDMVNYDLTRQHINWYRDEVQMGGKLTVGKKGYWVTNNLTAGAAAIAVGDIAVLTSSGNIMNIPVSASLGAATWNRALNPLVGKFLSTLDEDGYAKVEIQFPI